MTVFLYSLISCLCLDHEKENKKKKKVRNVPPLFDLIESARSLHKKGNKKESMQSASKIHAKVYK